MKNLLIDAFNVALNDYCNQTYRGYKKGFFSGLRHSFKKTSKITTLEKALEISKDSHEALSVVVEFLLTEDATFHNHSFNSYLIDALKIRLDQIDWDCFTPKAIKKYHGPVYRGTSRPPEKIFDEGFQELSASTKIEYYLKFRNKSIGISTSKDFECTMEYALNNKRSGTRRFIYAINYREENGYDILNTGKSRGLNFNPLFHKDRYSGFKKQEVNVKGIISKYDIVGAWEILKNHELAWRDNPNFQLERPALHRSRELEYKS